MERRDLYEDDLTDERNPTPAQIDDAAHDLKLDPDTLDESDERDSPDPVQRERAAENGGSGRAGG